MGAKKETEFLAAIQAHRGLIYKAASIYTDSVADREDLIQEIIFELWRSFERYEGRASLATWMYRVAMNTAIYHLKKAKRRLITLPFERIDPDAVIDAGEGGDEQWQLLQAHLKQLSPMEKSLVFLYLEQLPYRDIAEIMGISESNVGTRMARLKAKLKAAIHKASAK